MRRLSLISLILIVLAAPTLAQTPFVLDGLGQNVERGTARDVGRGGWGVAERDTLNPGSLNPAAMADLRYVQLLFSGSGQRTLDSTPGVDRVTWHTTLPYVRLAAPLKKGRLSFHTGFHVKRTFEYESYELFTVDRFGEEFQGYQTYQRTGNIIQIPLGLSWRLQDKVALGTAVNLVRGPVEDRIAQVFDDGPLANDYSSRLELEGTSVTASVLVSDLGPLSLGATVTTGYDLEAERTEKIEAVAGTAVTVNEVSMPAEYRVGLALDLGRDWRFGADGQYMAFGDIGDQVVWPGDLCDEWTVSVGLERRLVRHERGRGYQLPLRFGLQRHRWGHEVNGQPIDETVISVGTGVPFRNWRGAIDLSLSYAWIGSEADHGVESQALRLGLSISGLERLVF